MGRDVRSTFAQASYCRQCVFTTESLKVNPYILFNQNKSDKPSERTQEVEVDTFTLLW